MSANEPPILAVRKTVKKQRNGKKKGKPEKPISHRKHFGDRPVSRPVKYCVRCLQPALISGCSSDGEKMGTDADQRRLLFNRPQQRQELRSLSRVAQALGEVW